jgi:hypothetical protein
MIRSVTWRAPYFDVRTGLFAPQLVLWDPETGECMSVAGPKGFVISAEAEQAGRFLRVLSAAKGDVS